VKSPDYWHSSFSYATLRILVAEFELSPKPKNTKQHIILQKDVVSTEILPSSSTILHYVLDCGFWKLHLHLNCFCAQFRIMFTKPQGYVAAFFGVAREFFSFPIPRLTNNTWDFICTFHNIPLFVN
jgi:hypothetical protein